MARTRNQHLALYSAALAILPFALSPSCGRAARPVGPTPTLAPAVPTAFIEADRVRGGWVWSHADESDGVRRIEHERWSLSLDGAAITGRYTRKVSFLSTDGKPFDCSQTLSYSLSSTFELSGTAHTRHLVLEERDVRTTASPCESGFRRLGRYEGFLTDAGLMLIWKGGSQTLTRQALPETDAEPALRAADGRWEWQNSTEEESAGEVRVEREDWELTEQEDGALRGTYLRVVTVYDPDGRAFACSGQSRYQFTDRYTVAGVRRGTRVVLSEVAVDAEPHPCVPHEGRHLDAAVGTLEGGYLELTWRGSHRQVLHRPVEPRADATAPAETAQRSAGQGQPGPSQPGQRQTDQRQTDQR
ncbi:MAG TPA: hypothetical protein VML75_09740 [Kofleriaceae bacterium]|nr:hypothetical protein [Kofleriaceae bacterium]